MTVVATLKRARALLAGGWTGPAFLPSNDGRDASGRPVRFDSEGIVDFTVDGALRASARDDAELLGAWRALERTHHPIMCSLDDLFASLPRSSDGNLDTALVTAEQVRHWLSLERAATAAQESHLDAWLGQADRKLGDVLGLFDLTILRAAVGRPGARAMEATIP